MTPKYRLSLGMKRRVLDTLHHLIILVEEDSDRDTITFRAAELMPMVANQFAYVTPEKPKKTRKAPRDRAHAVDLGDEGR